MYFIHFTSVTIIYCYVVQQMINVNPLVLEEFMNGKSVDNNNILRKMEEALGM